MCVVVPFILDVRFVDVPAGATQDFSTFLLRRFTAIGELTQSNPMNIFCPDSLRMFPPKRTLTILAPDWGDAQEFWMLIMAYMLFVFHTT